MQNTVKSKDKTEVGTQTWWTQRSSMIAALALGTWMSAGCDPEVEDGSDGQVEQAVRAELPEGQIGIVAPQGSGGPPVFTPSHDGFQTEPPAVEMIPFDFDTGNAPVEVVIPRVVPVIFENVAPGDATIVLRFTTLLTNAWFDATAPYHPTAVGVFSNLGRRPASESATNANMNIAIMYASYRTLNSLAPQRAAEWDAMMEGLGLDPDDDHESTTDPIGIGNLAARQMLEVREHDGFNQLGFEGGQLYNPRPFGDYTGYKPVNPPDKVIFPGRWQPDIVQNRYGITRVQRFVTPQYALTLPYSYDDPSVYTVPAPLESYPFLPNPWVGYAKYKAQADHVLDVSANLTDEQKAKAEFFDNKIRSLGFSTLFSSVSLGYDLIDFVHYDFVVNVAAFDAGIPIWQEKAKWDAVRPFSAIAWIYGDHPVTAWGGPGQGTVNDMPADQWRPYLQTADHPEYPSASTAFCAAHAQASRLFTGSDNLGWVVPIPAGSSVVEPGVTPAQDIDIEFATWTDFATDCGTSRVWGGVHFEAAVTAGAPVGTEIGTNAYEFVKAHIDGDV